MNRNDSLPQDIYSEISKHVPVGDQSSFRRVNRLASRSQVDRNWCLRDITPQEIARWLLQQQAIVKEDIRHHKSSLWGSFDARTLKIRLVNVGESYKLIDINMINGNLENNGSIIEPDQLINYLTINKLRYLDPLNFKLIFNILKERISCHAVGLTSQQIFNELLAEHMEYVKDDRISTFFRIVTYNVESLLSNIGINRFRNDLIKMLDVPDELGKLFFKYGFGYYAQINNMMEKIYAHQQFTTTLNIFNIDLNHFNSWLRSWILSLTPEDLNY